MLALVAAVLPLPADQVERVYSHGLYRRLQPVISSISELSPIAWLDPAAAVLLASLIVVCVRRYRAFGLRVTILRMLMTGLVTAAVIYLWFLLFWGFNYRRLPLEQKLAYDPSHHPGARPAAWPHGRRSGQCAGRASGIASIDTTTLLGALRSVQAHLREGPLAAAPEPKRSLLALYFRKRRLTG